MTRAEMEALAGTLVVGVSTKNIYGLAEELQKALSQLLEQTRWRKVSEELPEIGQEILTTFGNGSGVDWGRHNSGTRLSPRLFWLPIQAPERETEGGTRR